MIIAQGEQSSMVFVSAIRALLIDVCAFWVLAHMAIYFPENVEYYGISSTANRVHRHRKVLEGGYSFLARW